MKIALRNKEGRTRQRNVLACSSTATISHKDRANIAFRLWHPPRLQAKRITLHIARHAWQTGETHKTMFDLKNMIQRYSLTDFAKWFKCNYASWKLAGPFFTHNKVSVRWTCACAVCVDVHALAKEAHLLPGGSMQALNANKEMVP